MKWTRHLLFVVVVALVAVPAWGQPAPVAKAAPAVAPAAAPAAKAPISITGKVEVENVAPTAAPAGSAPAPAATPVVQTAAVANTETQSWWQHLLVTIISTVGAIAVPVLSLLLVILLKRWNIKIELDKVQAIAKAAKDFGEQKARSALKDGKPLAGPEVAKIALEKGREMALGKLAGWATAQLENYIEAQCGADNKDKPITPA